MFAPYRTPTSRPRERGPPPRSFARTGRAPPIRNAGADTRQREIARRETFRTTMLPPVRRYSPAWIGVARRRRSGNARAKAPTPASSRAYVRRGLAPSLSAQRPRT
ncbi:MAG: hypothetical protein ACYTKD_28220 [Planctomycetota bacterium]